MYDPPALAVVYDLVLLQRYVAELLGIPGPKQKTVFQKKRDKRIFPLVLNVYICLLPRAKKLTIVAVNAIIV